MTRCRSAVSHTRHGFEPERGTWISPSEKEVGTSFRYNDIPWSTETTGVDWERVILSVLRIKVLRLGR